MPAKLRYVAALTTHVRKTPPRGKKVQQLIWGDRVHVKGPARDGWVPVTARHEDGWLRESELQDERLLEVTFIDVGQGDGAVVATPGDQHIVVDGGRGQDVADWLRWRYTRFPKPMVFDAAVMTHGDEDHYGGFRDVFEIENLTFEKLYTNGIVDRLGSRELGRRRKVRGEWYLTDLIRSMTALKRLVLDEEKVGRKRYPGTLAKGVEGKRFAGYAMLSHHDEYLPGHGEDKECRIRVLGPWNEGSRTRPRLRELGSTGETKNGHSIVLMLEYRDVRILLGGDLNTKSEELLLEGHAGRSLPGHAQADREDFLAAARRIWNADVAKACHHGSSDFLTVFLESLDAAATIISSGDNEPYAHPRADALGAAGKYGRGARPLVLSTELGRSPGERKSHPQVLRERVARTDEEQKAIERSVAVHGSIYLRTDGQRVLLAQKLERPSRSREWQTYVLEPDAQGRLHYAADP